MAGTSRWCRRGNRRGRKPDTDVYMVGTEIEASGFRGRVVRDLHTAGCVLSELAYEAGLDAGPHTHPRPYFAASIRGAYVEFARGEKIICDTSTVIFRPAGFPHRATNSEVVGRTFNVELLPAWRDRVQGPVLSTPLTFRTGAVPQLMRRLYEEFRYADPSSPLAIEGVVLEMLAECQRALSQPSGRIPRWLHEVQQILRSRFQSPPSLDDLARTVGVHPVHLARCFREKFRCSISGFVHQLRVEYACDRLSSEDVALSELAVDCGFSDQSHFTKIFKRLVGVTPAQYRQMRRES